MVYEQLMVRLGDVPTVFNKALPYQNLAHFIVIVLPARSTKLGPNNSRHPQVVGGHSLVVLSRTLLLGRCQPTTPAGQEERRVEPPKPKTKVEIKKKKGKYCFRLALLAEPKTLGVKKYVLNFSSPI